MKLTESKLQRLVFEELQLMVENGEIDEGILDRLKARAAGAGEKLKGSARSATQRAVGAIQGAIGDEDDAARTRQKAQLTKYASGQAAKNKQALSMMKSYSNKTNKLRVATSKVFGDLMKDLKKLGLETKDLDETKESLSVVLQILFELTNQLKQGKVG
tara:strand:+ start:381 stop:857 length:477 start_codon:yes stop_codon:yes gene_type:complete